MVLAGSVTTSPRAVAAGTVPAARAACGATSGFRTVALSARRAGPPTPSAWSGAAGPARTRRTTGCSPTGRPSCPSGCYRECTVRTPGVPTRGARRTVTGDATPKSYSCTADRCATSALVDITR
ncbi:ribonuclease domain-containing protein [Actinosynnema sp. NPDC053489]|uniref:ribonuclease domain-containing protein n=1 Tax=Actinosynnema sp. NPDC053489 TaxID=3363916 RepID=UPI0037C949E5